MLSLYIPSRHATHYDHEESIGARTQFFTDDVSLRRKQSGSALLGFPIIRFRWVCFTGLSWSAFATACRIAGPPGGSDQAFRPANGGFTPELSTGRSPFSRSEYNYGGN